MTEPCAHLWCVIGNPLRRRTFHSATCGRCNLAVLTLETWARVDHDAFAQAVDPDGLQTPPCTHPVETMLLAPMDR